MQRDRDLKSELVARTQFRCFFIMSQVFLVIQNTVLISLIHLFVKLNDPSFYSEIVKNKNLIFNPKKSYIIQDDIWRSSILLNRFILNNSRIVSLALRGNNKNLQSRTSSSLFQIFVRWLLNHYFYCWYTPPLYRPCVHPVLPDIK